MLVDCCLKKTHSFSQAMRRWADCSFPLLDHGDSCGPRLFMARLTDKLSAVELTGLAHPLADTDVTCTTGPCGSREWRTGGSPPLGYMPRMHAHTHTNTHKTDHSVSWKAEQWSRLNHQVGLRQKPKLFCQHAAEKPVLCTSCNKLSNQTCHTAGVS